MKMKALNVTQVNNYIKRILQSDPVLTNISVKGEVSNIKYHESGHVYFSLKDHKSKMSCFISYENSKNMKYILENGMEITISGYIFVYEKNGSFSLNVIDMVVEGQGNLHIAFEKLKEKLEKEGLFDVSKKKKLPLFPKTIAVITSATGAAIKDILMTIKRKNNYVDVLIFPCLVQGDYASSEISKTMEIINNLYPNTDIIIMGRGGGSMEELWPFNEEAVARSIDASKIPVISAVGHETDFSISDFVADVRAATPTAAAEIAVPDSYELRRKIDKFKRDSDITMNQVIEERQHRLQKHNFRVMTTLLDQKIQNYQLYCEQREKEIRQGIIEKMNNHKNEIEKYLSVLDHLNPENILKRGYAAVVTEDDEFVKSIDDVGTGESIRIALTDGSLYSKVTGKELRGSGVKIVSKRKEDRK